MKKKILSIAMVTMVAVAAAWCYSSNNNDVALADLALSNVEALASGELGNGYYGHKQPRIDCIGCSTGYNCWGSGIITC
jgi:hypothetical protein